MMSSMTSNPCRAQESRFSCPTQQAAARPRRVLLRAQSSPPSTSTSSQILPGPTQPPASSTSSPQPVPFTTSTPSLPQQQPNQNIQQPLPLQQDLLGITNSEFLATTLLTFALITTDVFAPTSLHLLAHLDQQLHQLVTTHTDYMWRKQVADVEISDAFITAAIAGWLATSAAAAIKLRFKALPSLSAAWAFYCFGAGAVFVDPALVASIKNTLQRARPSALHHTFSFPSGHTTAAVFTMGALLLVLLPMLLEEQGEQRAGSEPDISNSTQTAAMSLLQQVALPVWVAAGVTTAAGRVLADAHWFSDTLAGAALGSACVSALAMTVKVIRRPRVL